MGSIVASTGPLPPELIRLPGPFLLSSVLRARVVAALIPAAFTEEAVMAQFDLKKLCSGRGERSSVRGNRRATRMVVRGLTIV